jgi:hypothetical protein
MKNEERLKEKRQTPNVEQKRRLPLVLLLTLSVFL